MSPLDAFFAPRSIAVIGASTQPGSISRRALDGLASFAFPGAVYAVNPGATEIGGVACFASVADLPEPAELALIFTSAARTPAVIDDLVCAGTKAAILFTSGFAETGAEGRAVQDEMRARAALGGLRLLGPNCQGVIHLPKRLVATFTMAVTADSMPPLSPIAYAGQSGALGGSIFDLLRERGATPSVWVSTGNQVDVDLTEIGSSFVDDPAVELVMLYVEQTPPGERFEAMCAAARRAGKQIAVLRSGVTAGGRQAIASHTGAIVGDDKAFELVCAEHGVAVAHDIDEFVALAQAWRSGAHRGGRRLAIVSTSGGSGALAADHAALSGLRLSTFSPATVEELSRYVPAYGSTTNPVDMTAISAVPRLREGPGLANVYRSALDDDDVDQLLVVVNVVLGITGESVATTVAALAATHPKPIHAVFVASHDRSAAYRAVMQAAGVAVFDSFAMAARSIAAWANDREAPSEPPAHSTPVDGDGDGDGAVVIGEAAAAALLDKFAIPRPESVLVTTAEAAASAAARMGSVALKVQSPTLTHKTEHGAVQLGVSASDAAAVFDGFAARFRDISFDGVLVQAMAPPGVELLVGVQRGTDGYRPVVTVGAGGTAVELYADVASALAPIDDDAALALLRRLRAWPLLDGFRASAPADVDAAARAISAIAQMALAYGDRLIELEINPLIVHARGHGATAVDCLVRLRP